VLLAALAGLDFPGRVETCFYLDGCDDGSEALLRSAAATSRWPIHVTAGARQGGANAGRARRAALAEGIARLDGAAGSLFTTDADSAPARDWIAAGDAALRVADVVAGRIVRHNGAADLVQSRIELYYDRLHAYRRRIDPVAWEATDSHHCGGGANIAVGAATYLAVGGFRPLPHAEDATFLDDAARAGFRVRRDAALVVETSSRRIGRAAHGLADALRWLDSGELPEVAHPHAVVWQARGQAHARAAFATIDTPASRTALGMSIGLTEDHILGVARDCPNAEAFAMRVVPAPPGDPAPVPLGVAETVLAELEAIRCEAAA